MPSIHETGSDATLMIDNAGLVSSFMPAHELNQPLAVITNYLRGARALVARLELPDDDRLEAIEQAGDQAICAGEIVRTMRRLVAYRHGARRSESLAELNSEIGFTIGFFGRECDVTVTRRLSGGHDVVLADRIRIQHAILNLVRNAAEAVRHGARRLIVVRTAAHGPNWMVKVEDSGPGIAPSIAHRLSEPLTRADSDESGLGLSIARAVVESHGESLWVETSRLGGAALCFTLASPTGSDSGLEGAKGLGSHGFRD